MKNCKANEMQIEENIVTLIEDEDYDGAASPAATPTIKLSVEVVSAVTAVTSLLGVTSACTRDCWHPGN